MSHMNFIGEKLPEQPQRTIIGEWEKMMEICRLANTLINTSDSVGIRALCFDLERKARKLRKDNEKVKGNG